MVEKYRSSLLWELIGRILLGLLWELIHRILLMGVLWELIHVSPFSGFVMGKDEDTSIQSSALQHRSSAVAGPTFSNKLSIFLRHGFLILSVSLFHERFLIDSRFCH